MKLGIRVVIFGYFELFFAIVHLRGHKLWRSWYSKVTPGPPDDGSLSPNSRMIPRTTFILQRRDTKQLVSSSPVTEFRL